MTTRRLALLLLFAALPLSQACSSSSSTSTTGGTDSGCATDPFACPKGQTCWQMDVAGSKFQCLNAGPGKAGESCQNTVGSPSCGEGLACFAVSGSAQGPVCTPYCDATSADHGCPNSEQCLPLQTQAGVLVHECKPGKTTGSGGGGGSGGSGGKGGNGGAGGSADMDGGPG